MHDLSLLVINMDNGLRGETMKRALTLERLHVVPDQHVGASKFGWQFAFNINATTKSEMRAGLRADTYAGNMFSRLYAQTGDALVCPALALSSLLFLYEGHYRVEAEDADSFNTRPVARVLQSSSRDAVREERALHSFADGGCAESCGAFSRRRVHELTLRPPPPAAPRRASRTSCARTTRAARPCAAA